MALSVILKEFFGRTQQVLADSNGDQIDALAESNGTPKVVNYGYGVSDDLIPFQVEANGEQMISLYGKASGTVTAVGVEATTGEQRMVLMGYDGSALQRVKTETTRELDIVVHGKHGNTVVAPLINNDNQKQLVIEERPHYVPQDPLVLANSDGALVDLGADSGQLFEVSFFICNTTAGAVTATVGVDIGAAGSLSAGEHFISGLSVPANDTTEWFGPFIVPGNDDIRGFASAATSLTIHFRIVRVV